MRSVCWAVAVMVLVGGCGAPDQPGPDVGDKDAGSSKETRPLSPDEQFEQLNLDYVQDVEKAGGQDGQQSPTIADQYAGKFLELASAHPESRTAFASLNWVAVFAKDPALQNQAIDQMVANHVDNVGLSRLNMQMAQKPLSDESDAQLTKMIEKSSDESVRASATMALASQLSSVPEDQQDETRIKALYQSVVDQYASQPRMVAAANQALAKFRFRIGQIAPEIDGEDLDGQAFKLSDYRGKVVVLDFWGDW